MIRKVPSNFCFSYWFCTFKRHFEWNYEWNKQTGDSQFRSPSFSLLTSEKWVFIEGSELFESSLEVFIWCLRLGFWILLCDWGSCFVLVCIVCSDSCFEFLACIFGFSNGFGVLLVFVFGLVCDFAVTNGSFTRKSLSTVCMSYRCYSTTSTCKQNQKSRTREKTRATHEAPCLVGLKYPLNYFFDSISV